MTQRRPQQASIQLEIGGPFPWRGTCGGVPVVAIPAAEFRQLAGEPPLGRGITVRRLVTRWDADPELATFVRERFGRMQQKAIRSEVLARFGADRTPSLTAISRYSVRCALEEDRAGRA